jgi:hypothetical protein
VDQPDARPLPTHRRAQNRKMKTHTSMPRAGFETAIPVLEPSKTVRDLDSAATRTGACIVNGKGKAVPALN